MTPTPEQLLAELAECRALLRYATERLDAIATALLPIPDAETPPGIPRKDSPGNAGGNGTPAGVSHGNPNASPIPAGQSRRNAGAIFIPGGALPGNPPDPFLPSVGQLAAILKRDGFRTRTTVLYIRRAASLMLSLHADPGVRDVSFFARLMDLSYSGAAKAIMELRREGFIRREKPQVHVLTEKGLAMIEAARGYAAPLD